MSKAASGERRQAERRAASGGGVERRTSLAWVARLGKRRRRPRARERNKDALPPLKSSPLLLYVTYA